MYALTTPNVSFEQHRAFRVSTMASVGGKKNMRPALALALTDEDGLYSAQY
jgi:hypothetical protein